MSLICYLFVIVSELILNICVESVPLQRVDIVFIEWTHLLSRLIYMYCVSSFSKL